METFKITKSDLADFFEPHTSISEIFTWLEGDFLAQNKLVCQFIINGRELTEVEEIDWAAKPFEMVQDIQIRVQDENDLISDVLFAWIEALPEMITFIENVAQQTSVGTRSFSVKDLLELVNQQETFVTSLMSLRAPLKKQGFSLEDWSKAEKSLYEYVMQCVKHIETKNFVQLIETLEYDGANALEQWRQILCTMKEKIDSNASVNSAATLPSSSVSAEGEE